MYGTHYQNYNAKKRKLCGQQKLVKSNFQPKSKNDEKKLITTIVLAIKV